jgi:hypothetical protein
MGVCADAGSPVRLLLFTSADRVEATGCDRIVQAVPFKPIARTAMSG